MVLAATFSRTSQEYNRTAVSVKAKLYWYIKGIRYIDMYIHLGENEMSP